MEADGHTNCSPFVAPFLLGYMIAKTGSWRDVYWVGVGYVSLVVILITFFMEETHYEREREVPNQSGTGLKYRIETLVGVTGIKVSPWHITSTSAVC